jgi:hypothetical protein
MGDAMEPSITTARPQHNTRRWPRYQIDLPVRIVAMNGILTAPVMARGSEISRAGMALHANIALNPGDLMQLQFPTTEPSRVTAVVRYRSADRLGLEFLSQLPPDTETKHHMRALSGAVLEKPAALSPKAISCTPSLVDQGLRRKQEELRQLQREIEVLSIAILLLAEDETEICHLPTSHPWEPQDKPWPKQP